MAKYIPFSEACEQIGITRQTGYNKVHQGIFPIATYKEGRQSFVLESELNRYLKKRFTPTRAAPAARRGRRRLAA